MERDGELSYDTNRGMSITGGFAETKVLSHS